MTIGSTTSSYTMFWSAAGENTLSNVYVLLATAFGPIDKFTACDLMPSVETTTPLLSFVSRSSRPRHRTTTWMLVSSLISRSKSLSFLLLVTLGGSAGDFGARDALVVGCFAGTARESDLPVVRLVGIRCAVVRLVGRPEAGRCGPVMVAIRIPLKKFYKQ